MSFTLWVYFFQGKDLFMDLDDGALKLIDPESLNTLHTQPIHTIRVWGVGRDNGRWELSTYIKNINVWDIVVVIEHYL